MASHGIDWTSGAHVRFWSLGFLSVAEEGLAWAPTTVQPPCPTGLDVTTEALEEL
jgi:hypothetical protein